MDNSIISKLYLASKSPRRRELMAQIGLDFAVLALDIAEEVAPGEGYLAYSQRISQQKAEAAWAHVVANQLPQRPIVSADTEVVIGEDILGKPRDYADAFNMWRRLAGKSHIVITSLTLKYADFTRTETRQSVVYFDNLTDQEIHAYLASGDYRDKSGAYGIQSYAGQFIQRIDGCFYAIMGLPLNALRNLLQELAAYAN